GEGGLLLNALDQPRERILTLREYDVVLQDVVQIDMEAAIMIENGDGSSAIDRGPKFRLHAMVVTLRPALEHRWAPFSSVEATGRGFAQPGIFVRRCYGTTEQARPPAGNFSACALPRSRARWAFPPAPRASAPFPSSAAPARRTRR